MIITKEILQSVCARGAKEKNVSQLLESLKKWLPIYEINSNLRIAAFLSQCSYETGGFIFFRELGNQSYFDKYEPETKIGKILGNTEEGDGCQYKGRGILQLTGRSNYAKYGSLVNEDLINDPNLLLIPDISVHVACEFWKQLKLNELADEKNIREITIKINGGINGLEERLNYYNLLIKVLDVK